MSPTPAIAPKQPTRTGWALLLTSAAIFMVTLDSLVGVPVRIVSSAANEQVG